MPVLEWLNIMKKLCGIKETEKCASGIAAGLLSAGPGKRATVVGLRGDLGSGKTVFTKALAKKLGVTENVLSPTFVIMKTYNLQPTTHNPQFCRFRQIEFYLVVKVNAPSQFGGGGVCLKIEILSRYRLYSLAGRCWFSSRRIRSAASSSTFR